MDSLLPFSIPVKGLRAGHHAYEFVVDSSFFASFEDAPLSEAQVEVTLDLEKRTDMLELQFRFSGTVRSECDRCLATIDLPVEGENRLLVKYSWEEEESTDEDVVYIHPDTPKLQVAPFVYEFVILSLPLIKVYDCEEDEEPPCDWEMLDHLDRNEEPSEEEEDKGNPFKDALKGWKKPE